MSTGLTGLVVCWVLLVLLLPRHPLARALGLSCVAMLPAVFYMYPMITNEVFAAGVIAAGIVAACYLGPTSGRRWWWMFAVGVLCGLGLLAKFTGLFLFLALLATCGLLVVTSPRSPRGWLSLAILLLTVGAISGWYYIRNYREYGNAFIGNWDEASGSHYEQTPGYRTTGFYVRFGQVLFGKRGSCRNASFWDGQYGSAWGDSHSALIHKRHGRHIPPPAGIDPDALAAIICWLALLPTAGILAGIAHALRHVLTVNWRHPYLILLLTTLLTVTGVIFFTMEVPSHTTIKAFFMVSLLPAVAVYAALGLDLMRRNLGRLHWLMYVFLLAQYALTLCVYRFAPP
jgi:4-amino-4-deoxy-L-arabinose transferase-like glycosyltransferase